MSNRTRVASFIVLCALGALSCGEDEAVRSPPVIDPPDVAIVTLDVQTGEGTDEGRAREVESAVEVVRARLAALGVEGEVGWDDATIEVLVPGGDQELIRSAMQPVGEFQIRPVLELLEPTDAPAPTGEAPDPSAEAFVASRTGERYRLGPAALGAGAVEGTVVGQGSAGDWTINPTFVEGPSGIDAFNAIAAACYSGAPSCPGLSADGRGQLALLVDDVVLSAPAIQTPSFGRNEIQLVGGFSEVDARSLAVSMDAGVSPVRWTVRD